MKCPFCEQEVEVVDGLVVEHGVPTGAIDDSGWEPVEEIQRCPGSNEPRPDDDELENNDYIHYEMD